MMQLFLKMFVVRFYKVNAGFLLLILLLSFGVTSAVETVALHHSIMLMASTSPVACGILLLALGLFGIRCASFTLRELADPFNAFLYNMQALDNKSQLMLLTLTHAGMFQLALAYGGITAWVGFTSGHFLYPFIITVALGGYCMGGGYLYFRRLNTTWQASPVRLPTIRLFRKTGYYAFLVQYALQFQKLAFVGIKVFSILLLQFLVGLNADKVSKENVCFVLLIVISAHCLLPMHFVKFVENEMPFLRNMPINLAKRFSIFLLTYAVIFIPELLFLFWNELGHLGWLTILSVYGIFMARMSFFTALQYVRALTTERYTLLVFVLFFATMILLASVSFVPFMIGESLLAAFLFWQMYYNYEPGEKKME